MSAENQLIQQIHDAPHQGVLAVSGAGSQAIAWLLGVAGASRTLLEVVVPYGRLSMIDLVGFEPDQFVSEDTALKMAKAAFNRAVKLMEGDFPAVGLGCTATIATDRPKRGEHRAYLATWDDRGWTSYSLHLTKGHRDRSGEEGLVSKLVVNALARASAVGPELGLDLIPTDLLEVCSGIHPNPLELLLSGDADSVTVGLEGGMTTSGLGQVALLPGSFNPLHEGHQGLARWAERALGTEVVYELSVNNVDKPPLTLTEVEGRLPQFRGKARVVLTSAETYQKKCHLFPGCVFVVGWDTAVRLVAPRYYGGGQTAMLRALADIWAAGCSFLVAGREEKGTFQTLDDVPIPEGFQPMFRAIPESAFRIDVSSTTLRASG